MTPVDRATLLVGDLAAVPAILRRHAAAGPVRPPLGHPSRLVMVGLGSSRYAALAVAPWLREAGLDVVVEHASAGRPVRPDPAVLVVAISASGRTPETVTSARRSSDGGAQVLAITNAPASPLGASAGAIVSLDAGTEGSGIASASYVATVAALLRLAGGLGAIDDPAVGLSSAAEAVESLVGGGEEAFDRAAALLDGGAAVHVLADGANLGTADQTALLLREAPRLESTATDTGDWLHVGIYTALPGGRALLLAGAAADDQAIATLHRRSCRVVGIAPAGQPPGGLDAVIDLPATTVDPLVRILVEPVASGLLAAALWRRVSGYSPEP